MKANIPSNIPTIIDLPDIHCIKIRGKEYEFDVSDINVLEGISEDYPRILKRVADGRELEIKLKDVCHEIGVQNPATSTLGAVLEDVAKSDNADAAESIKEIAVEITQCNKDIIALCKGMIEGCLGVEEYKEITKGKMNINTHMSLCAGLFMEANRQRDSIVNEAAELSDKLKERYGDATENNTP